MTIKYDEPETAPVRAILLAVVCMLTLAAILVVIFRVDAARERGPAPPHTVAESDDHRLLRLATVQVRTGRQPAVHRRVQRRGARRGARERRGVRRGAEGQDDQAGLRGDGWIRSR
jgi:hypothetical protein